MLIPGLKGHCCLVKSDHVLTSLLTGKFT